MTSGKLPEKRGNSKKAKYYISSCVLKAKFPELSSRIQKFVQDRYGLTVIRCCVPRYRLKEFTEQMPEGSLRESWSSLPDSADFRPEDEIYSLRHNCNNIIEETHPGLHVRSLWELLDQDESFPLPDCHGLQATVQDCWRSRDRKEEQDAVRSLLRKNECRLCGSSGKPGKHRVCGASLYRPQPVRNPKLAPKHYVTGAEGKFVPHTPEEQEQIMEEYCKSYTTSTVICYCHYCLEGLKLGKKESFHIAEMLFPPN